MPDHGTRARYLRGCTCDPCRNANRRYCKWYRLATRAETRRGPGNSRPTEPMREPAAPVVAHIAALAASGWRQADIAREAGIDSGYLSRLIGGQFRGVHRRNAAALLALEPLRPVDVDEVMVDRLTAGADWHDMPCTKAEREAAWLRIDHTARTAGPRGQDPARNVEGSNAAAKRLGLNTTDVRRLRESRERAA